MNQVIISFPGLGIGEFTVNKVAFSIGSLEVHWYGIIIVLGIMAGVLYAIYRGKHEGVSSEHVLDYALWVVLLAVIGARLYYVLFSLGEGEYKSFVDIIAVWNGGLAIYGGIIGGALGVIIVSKVKKFNGTKLLKICDMAAPSVMLGQIIGRWGNFINGEAHGEKVSETFFLRMGLMGDADGARPNVVTYFHPTFLYESLWNLIGFVLINLFYKKKKHDGQILLMYLAWYGFGRMLIEMLRTDSLKLGVFRVSSLIGLLCFVVCTVLLIYFGVREKRKGKDAEDYVTVYDNLRGGVSVQRASEIANAAQEEQNAQKEIWETEDPFDRANRNEE